MICPSIAVSTVKKYLEALTGRDFAEIRLDQMLIGINELNKVFSLPKRLIATCRPGAGDESERKFLLMAAMENGASLVDIEVDANDKYREELVEKAKVLGCQVIISYHNYKNTPTSIELNHLIQSCFQLGANIVKTACQVHSHKDTLRLFCLLEDKHPLVVIGMGIKGKVCRITPTFLGSAFTYTSLKKGNETETGQIDTQTLEDIINRIKNA
jgi:3-dehydroquinate dehydratase type I